MQSSFPCFSNKESTKFTNGDQWTNWEKCLYGEELDKTIFADLFARLWTFLYACLNHRLLQIEPIPDYLWTLGFRSKMPVLEISRKDVIELQNGGSMEFKEPFHGLN